MKRVVIESPYAGDVAANEGYARLAVRDSLLRGEAPIASHLLYTQPGVLNDDIPRERDLGMRAGFAWTRCADLVAVYVNRGVSDGMKAGVTEAICAGIPVVYRRVGEGVRP